jgi:negative regulator of sigma E activity
MSAAPLDQALLEALSATMDGRATPQDWARVEAAWGQDASLRERWAAWHAAGDGLRSAELAALHRPPEALLDALHARMPTPAASPPARGREWWPPLGVAASFVAAALVVGALRPGPTPDPLVATAPTPSRAPALAGLSFAQAAAGRALTPLGTTDAPAASIDWSLAPPDAPASRPLP